MAFITVVAVVLMIILVFSFAAACWLFRKMFSRDPGRKPFPYKAFSEISKASRQDRKEAMAFLDSLSSEPLSITSRDGLELHAEMFRPDLPSDRIVILVHCYRSSGRWDMSSFVPYYLSKGFNVLLPDSRAHGHSGGEYIGFGKLEYTDVVDWCLFLREHCGIGCSIALHGVSMGASIIMLAAASPELPSNVKSVCADCGYDGAHTEIGHVIKTYAHLPVFPVLNVLSILTRLRLGFYLKNCDQLEAVRHTDADFLFVHGDADSLIPVQMAYNLYRACSSPRKSLHIVHGAIHTQSWFIDRTGYMEKLDELLNIV